MWDHKNRKFQRNSLYSLFLPRSSGLAQGDSNLLTYHGQVIGASAYSSERQRVNTDHS